MQGEGEGSAYTLDNDARYSATYLPAFGHVVYVNRTRAIELVSNLWYVNKPCTILENTRRPEEATIPPNYVIGIIDPEREIPLQATLNPPLYLSHFR